MKKLARTDVIILDDWGLTKLTAPQRRELLDILEDRHRRRSTVVTSQLPVEHWHKMIGTKNRPTPMPSSTGSYTTPIAST